MSCPRTAKGEINKSDKARLERNTTPPGQKYRYRCQKDCERKLAGNASVEEDPRRPERSHRSPGERWEERDVESGYPERGVEGRRSGKFETRGQIKPIECRNFFYRTRDYSSA